MPTVKTRLFSNKTQHPRRNVRTVTLQASSTLWLGATLLAWSAAAGAADSPLRTPLAVPDTLAQRLQACTVCHGPEGRASASGYQPRIAGKPAHYLYNQLLNFREARRSNSAMSSLIAPLTPAYLREMAEHFASIDLPYPPPQTRDAPAAQLQRGQQLVTQGDPQLGIAACTSCHGAAMTGVRTGIPGLLGLPRDYISGQLGAWQTGLRRAQAPDCMGAIARKLPATDVAALAAWLSSQALPADTHPVAALPQALPQDCGGLVR